LPANKIIRAFAVAIKKATKGALKAAGCFLGKGINTMNFKFRSTGE
jgi:hypothetical protein